MKTRVEWIMYNILSLLGMTYMSEDNDRIVIAPMMFIEYLLLGGSYFVGLAWMVSNSGYVPYKDLPTLDAMVSFGRWELIPFCLIWIILLWCNKENNFRVDDTAYYRKVLIPYKDILSLSNNYNIYRREWKKKELEKVTAELQNSIDKLINKNKSKLS